MGTVSSNPAGEEAGTLGNIPQNLRKMELKIDFSKPEHPSLKQILYWSLAEIRQVYENFQRRSRGNVAFMDKTLFCKIVPFTRTNAIFIFENFSRNNKYLSIYEFICVLTICAYTHYINKIHFLYILFDLDCNGGISLNELLIIFKSIVMGYCKLTQSQMPSYQNLEKFAKIMFLKSDIQADNSLELKEIVEWVDQNQTAKELFLRYEPQYSVKENYDIFRLFKKYTEEQAEELLKQINKANRDEYFYNDLGKLMGGNGGQNKYLENTQSLKNQQKRFLPSIQKNQGVTHHTEGKNELDNFEEEIDNDLLDRALDQHAKKYDNKKLLEDNKFQENNSRTFAKNQSLPGLRRKVNLKDMNKEFSQTISKNIIIIKGDTLTKQDVFQLKEYFDQLSDKNSEITIKEFTKAFQKKEHMKRVCASIFNFLDDKQIGKISFHDLLIKLYPSLHDPQKKNAKVQNDLKLINQWIKSYQKTFQSDGKEFRQDQKEAEKNSKKKRVLPKSSMVRIREIFNLLDDEKKGYLNQKDLQKHFQGGFSQKEVDKLFLDYDTDQDGKLMIEDFIKMILPKDYQIEDKDE